MLDLEQIDIPRAQILSNYFIKDFNYRDAKPIPYELEKTIYEH